MIRAIILGYFLCTGLAWAQPKPATLFLVRHAERAGGTAPEVPLSPAGRERARLLARMLSEAGVNSITVSDALRTQQSAAPLARKLKLTSAIVKGGDYDALTAAARAIPPGGKALFVRHSNELPEIVKNLGGGVIAPLPDTEFDRFLVLVLVDGKAVSVTTLRYGR